MSIRERHNLTVRSVSQAWVNLGMTPGGGRDNGKSVILGADIATIGECLFLRVVRGTYIVV